MRRIRKRKGGIYKYRGRADDLIVLSNGEKINTILMENIIASHPKISATLIVGEYRFNPALLVEIECNSAPENEAERYEILNIIWPTVQEGNRIATGFAKIPKSLILFVTKGKPFSRAGKGTVQRQSTVKAYATELNHLYSPREVKLLTEGLTLKQSDAPEVVKTFVREIFSQALELELAALRGRG